MVTEPRAETNRPYAPPSNVISVLQRLRSRNLPERVDIEYLRDAGVSKGTVGRTLFGLRFLGLITDANSPTDALRTVHTATDEEYQQILMALIKYSYADVFNVVDPSEDSHERILNVFRRYTPASQRDRMVIFFLGLCREAGIPVSDQPRKRSMREPRPQRTSTPSAASNPQASRRTPRQRSHSETVLPGGVQLALDGLIKSLPAIGDSLSDARLEQWLSAARATLRFIYPEQAPDSAESSEHGEN